MLIQLYWMEIFFDGSASASVIFPILSSQEWKKTKGESFWRAKKGDRKDEEKKMTDGYTADTV